MPESDPAADPSHRIGAALQAAPIVHVRWTPAVRVVAAYPPIAQLEEIGDPDLQAAILAELASVTPEILGNPAFLPNPLPLGRGASRIITAYTFSRPNRFNDEAFAAFYGAESLDTAIRETVYHALKTLQESNAPPQKLSRMVLHVDVDAPSMVDIRNANETWLYDPDRYGLSRLFGTAVRDAGHHGITYRSVRRDGGECVAVYRAQYLGNCREARDLFYEYTGENIEVSEVHFRTS